MRTQCRAYARAVFGDGTDSELFPEEWFIELRTCICTVQRRSFIVSSGNANGPLSTLPVVTADR
jgi:hypothetical protein